MTGAEADALARQVISRAGYGEAFGHSLGHGIGLVTHEKPTIGPNSTDIPERRNGLYRGARHLYQRLGRRAHRR